MVDWDGTIDETVEIAVIKQTYDIDVTILDGWSENPPTARTRPNIERS